MNASGALWAASWRAACFVAAAAYLTWFARRCWRQHRTPTP